MYFSPYSPGSDTLRDRYRKLKNNFMTVLLLLFSVTAAVPFFFIVFYVLHQGIQALNMDFFTQLPTPPGEAGGGMANALLGSLLILGMTSLVGVPFGISLGIYLSEYHRTHTASVLRTVTDLLMSVPSIVIGIFIYGVVVVRFGFSSYAGAMALTLILLPVVAKGTEEILKMIPEHIREAGLALGLPRWRVTLWVLLPGALSMILTVVMLALARVAGETAPLLFTALGNQFHIQSLNEPVATLPVQIYEFSKSGFVSQEKQAMAAALILVVFVFLINFVTRMALFLYKKTTLKKHQTMR